MRTQRRPVYDHILFLITKYNCPIILSFRVIEEPHKYLVISVLIHTPVPTAQIGTAEN